MIVDCLHSCFRTCGGARHASDADITRTRTSNSPPALRKCALTRWIIVSALESTHTAASSTHTIRELCSSARARHSSCRCPNDIFPPFSFSDPSRPLPSPWIARAAESSLTSFSTRSTCVAQTRVRGERQHAGSSARAHHRRYAATADRGSSSHSPQTAQAAAAARSSPSSTAQAPTAQCPARQLRCARL